MWNKWDRQLEKAGLKNPEGFYGTMVYDAIKELYDVFEKQGHSGMSASLVSSIFKKLVDDKPLVPLTDTPEDWVEISDGKFQHKECGSIFKDIDGRAYNIDGKVFYDVYKNKVTGEETKSHFTSKDSRVYITFPYTVTDPEYVWSGKIIYEDDTH